MAVRRRVGGDDRAGDICTIDKCEGGVKAKDLLRTAPGSPHEPGVWRPKLGTGHPGIILGGTSSTNHRYGHFLRP